MPTSVVLSPFGVHPCCAWSPSRGRFLAVWQWGDAVFTDFTDGPIIDLDGSEGAFPRIHTTSDGETWLSYRMGAAPYVGYRAALRDDNKLAVPISLGPIHGAFPSVFGRDWFAYQSGGADVGWPVMRLSLADDQPAVMVRHGVGTGLALIDSVGSVFTWDDVRGLVPGLHDPTSAGGLVCGATDRDGRPCVVVSHRATGDELVLWPGEDSQNPFITWDGGESYAVVAWSAAGQGVRRATFWRSELKPAEVPPPSREPVVARPSAPKAMAWWHDHGKNGEYWPVCHGTMSGLSMYKDGDGSYPADAPAKMRAAAERSGGCYLDYRDIMLAKSWWKYVIGVYLHEVGTPADVRWAASTARSTMRAQGLPVRPVIAVISPNDALNEEYAGSADAIAPEIYFDAPASSWDVMRQIARDRVDAVLAALAPTPVYLISQSYDRSDGAGPLYGPWESPAGRDQLTAIAQACFDSLSGSRVLGLFPFAYGRAGGATTYPELDRWYSAQTLALTRPPLPKDEEEEDEGMTHDELRTYMARLNDPLIFGALQRFHDEVLPRDRPVDPATNGEGGPFNTSDVVTGGAMGYFLRHYCVEAAIAQDKGRTPEQASGDAYDIALKAYMDVANPQ